MSRAEIAFGEECSTNFIEANVKITLANCDPGLAIKALRLGVAECELTLTLGTFRQHQQGVRSRGRCSLVPVPSEQRAIVQAVAAAGLLVGVKDLAN